MSSTNFGSILIFASCVVGTCNIPGTLWVSFFLMGGVLQFCLNIYMYVYKLLYMASTAGLIHGGSP